MYVQKIQCYKNVKTIANPAIREMHESQWEYNVVINEMNVM